MKDKLEIQTKSTDKFKSYIFTPNVGQCLATATLDVILTSFKYSITQDCIDSNYLIKVVHHATLSPSDYTFSRISNKEDF